MSKFKCHPKYLLHIISFSKLVEIVFLLTKKHDVVSYHVNACMKKVLFIQIERISRFFHLHGFFSNYTLQNLRGFTWQNTPSSLPVPSEWYRRTFYVGLLDPGFEPESFSIEVNAPNHYTTAATP